MPTEQLLAKYIGPFEVWEDITTKQRVFRLQDGSVYKVPYEEFALRDAWDLFLYLLDLLGRKEFEAAEAYLLNADNSPGAKRIAEINKELDIIRGVVPTPKGYTINLSRAKELMAELKRLMKAVQSKQQGTDHA